MTSLRANLARRARRILNTSLNLLLQPLSRLSARRADHWLFGHQSNVFAGNSKYLFLWISIHCPQRRAVWITDNEETRRLITEAGFVAYPRWSPSGILATLRSKVFVYCHDISDINPALSGGAYLLNLGHGVGIKATQLGDKLSAVSRHQKYRSWPLAKMIFPDFLTEPDALATTSPFMQQHFSSQCGIPAERCPQLGYPRLDGNWDKEVKEASTGIDRRQGFQFNPEGFGEIYLYVPTYRDSGRDFIAHALPDMDRLSLALKVRNALLYIKLHPYTEVGFQPDYPNVILWPKGVEVSTYLGQVDGLITDYSSLLYDFLFVRDTGAVLYTFDYDTYVRQDRSLVHSFEENTAGLRVSTFDELCQAISTGRVLEPCPGAAEIREKFWSGCSGPASPGVLRYVTEALQNAGTALHDSEKQSATAESQ